MTRLTLSSTRLALLCALALTNLACDDAASVSGGQPTAWDTYVVGLEKEGEKGEFKVRLLQSDPIPQDTGFYDWTVEVLTPDGAPVAGAIVLAKPTMPAHGHGTFPPQTEAVEKDSPGQYQLSQLDLFMAGVWRVEIKIQAPNGQSDVVVYNFDLEG